MGLLQETVESLIGRNATFTEDVAPEIKPSPAEVKSARFTGILQGQADSLFNADGDIPSPPGNIVLWAEQRTAYVKSFTASKLDKLIEEA